MGNKRPLLDFVVPAIEAQCSPGQTVLDLFAGVHSVGYALKSRHPVIANDIQAYSLVIGKAIIENREGIDTTLDEVWGSLREAYEENHSALAEVLAVPLEIEDGCLTEYALGLGGSDTDDKRIDRILRHYESLVSDYPYYRSDNGLLGNTEASWASELGHLFAKWIGERRTEIDSFPYALFSMYFANAYFGTAQSVVIDSLRYAVDVVFPEESDSGEDRLLRNICLSAMMYAASYCVAAPGHFAQFLRFDASNESGYRSIFAHRQREFMHWFRRKLAELLGQVGPSPYINNCYCRNYRQILDDEAIMSDVDLVYADPPYTDVHYSRFYHLLETLVRYDYPESRFTGRYRGDRHQSRFCQRSNVETEFRHLISTLSAQQKTLAVSYPDTGLLPLEDLKKLCQRYYSHLGGVIVQERKDYVHSTLGGKPGKSHKDVTETLIVCSRHAR